MCPVLPQNHCNIPLFKLLKTCEWLCVQAVTSRLLLSQLTLMSADHQKGSQRPRQVRGQPQGRRSNRELKGQLRRSVLLSLKI